MVLSFPTSVRAEFGLNVRQPRCCGSEGREGTRGGRPNAVKKGGITAKTLFGCESSHLIGCDAPAERSGLFNASGDGIRQWPSGNCGTGHSPRRNLLKESNLQSLSLRKVGSGLGALALIAGFAGSAIGLVATAASAATPPGTYSCTVTDTNTGNNVVATGLTYPATQPVGTISGATPGDTINFTCTGLGCERECGRHSGVGSRCI